MLTSNAATLSLRLSPPSIPSFAPPYLHSSFPLYPSSLLLPSLSFFPLASLSILLPSCFPLCPSSLLLPSLILASLSVLPSCFPLYPSSLLSSLPSSSCSLLPSLSLLLSIHPNNFRQFPLPETVVIHRDPSCHEDLRHLKNYILEVWSSFTSDNLP